MFYIFIYNIYMYYVVYMHAYSVYVCVYRYKIL